MQDTERFEEARASFLRGVEAYGAGDLPAAERHFQTALRLVPGRASTLTNLAATLAALDRPAEALPLVEQALSLEPGRPDLLIQQGLVLQALERHAEALLPVEKVLQQEPAHAGALRLHVRLLGALERHAEALASHAALLALEPADAEAWLMQGQSLLMLQRHEEALVSLRKAVELAPGAALAWSNLGSALRDLQRPAEAIAAFEQAIAAGGDAELARYHIAALRGDAAPASAPAQYVRRLFDGYAGSFDTHLVEVLRYEAPQRLVQGLQALPGFTRGAQALDLGCGTGLCGPLLAPLYGAIDGVDLSAPMLERARARGVYRHLVQADVVAFLQTQPSTWDLLLAADLFIYIGDLVPAFEAASTALRHGGFFSFSVEVAPDEGPDYVLQPSMRYAQSAASLRRMALRYGFEVLQMHPGPLRHEQQQEIPGLYVQLRKV